MAGSVIIRELLTVYGFDVDSNDLELAEGRLNALVKTAKVGATVFVAGAAAIFGFVQTTANAGDESAKTAKQVGLGVEALQEYRHAASLAGVEDTELTGGIQRLAKNLNAAARGEKTQAEALRKMGISAKNSKGELISTDEALTQIANHTASMPDSLEKTALMMDLFGRAGAKMIPMLNEGGAGIAQMRQEARDLGMVLSEEATRQSEDFNDGMTRMKGVLVGIRNEIGIALMPMMTEVVTGTREWFLANRELVSTTIQKFLGGVVKVSRVLWKGIVGLVDVMQRAVDHFGGWGKVLRWVGVAIGTLGIATVIAGFFGLVAVAKLAIAKYIALGTAAHVAHLKMLLIPLAIAAILVMIGLVIEDFDKFFDGQDSAIGELVKKYPLLGEVIWGLKDLWDDVSVAFGHFWDSVMEFIDVVPVEWDNLMLDLEAPWNRFFGGIKEGLEEVMGLIQAGQTMVMGVKTRAMGEMMKTEGGREVLKNARMMMLELSALQEDPNRALGQQTRSYVASAAASSAPATSSSYAEGDTVNHYNITGSDPKAVRAEIEAHERDRARRRASKAQPGTRR